MGRVEEIKNYLPRFKGKIKLIRGNHDTKPRIKVFESFGIEVEDIKYLEYKGKFFVLCHFPMTNEEFLQMVVEHNKEYVFLYGHIHGNAPTGYVGNTYHVGVDTNFLTPVSAEQIWRESQM